MTGHLILSDIEDELTETLRPHYSIHSISNPGKLNGNTNLPDVTVGVWANAIEMEDFAIAGKI